MGLWAIKYSDEHEKWWVDVVVQDAPPAVARGKVANRVVTEGFTEVTGLILAVSAYGAMYIYPRLQADKRRAALEEALPDALHHMAVSIRTGLVLESVIQEISTAEYGVLSDEFAQIVVEMHRGRPLKEALIAFSKRSGSKQVERAMRLLLEGVEAGGPISDVLDEVSDDIRAIRVVQRERKSMTSQQISFLAMASLIAGPFVMGVVAFAVGTAAGVLLGKVMYVASGRRINPLIGAAGISAFPMSARVVQKVGLEANPHSHLLMHAAGANTAGQIASVVAGGAVLVLVRFFA